MLKMHDEGVRPGVVSMRSLTFLRNKNGAFARMFSQRCFNFGWIEGESSLLQARPKEDGRNLSSLGRFGVADLYHGPSGRPNESLRHQIGSQQCPSASDLGAGWAKFMQGGQIWANFFRPCANFLHPARRRALSGPRFEDFGVSGVNFAPQKPPKACPEESQGQLFAKAAALRETLLLLYKMDIQTIVFDQRSGCQALLGLCSGGLWVSCMGFWMLV